MNNTTDKVLGYKTSVCEVCGSFVKTRILNKNRAVYYQKQCDRCGSHETLISIDVGYYLDSNQGNNREMLNDDPMGSEYGCPYNCGLCEEHKNNTCMIIIETTNDCDVRCKTCIAGSCPGGKKYLSLDELRNIIQGIQCTQGNIDLLMLSGGEPTIHPNILEMIDLCKEMGVAHTMIISNGIRIAKDPVFVAQLAARKENFEVYLQFDSLDDSVLHCLRGKDFSSQIRMSAVQNLEAAKIHYTLVCVIKKGLNDSEIKKIIQFALSNEYARGVTFQPLKDIGRGDVFSKKDNYLTLSEVRKMIADTGIIAIEELIPHPCNGNCISIGYLNKLRKPITSFLFNDFENREDLRKMMYYLPKLDTETIRYTELFRIAVVSFLDKYNFTLEDVKKCCICFAATDGRMVPFDTHYVYHNNGK